MSWLDAEDPAEAVAAHQAAEALPEPPKPAPRPADAESAAAASSAWIGEVLITNEQPPGPKVVHMRTGVGHLQPLGEASASLCLVNTLTLGICLSVLLDAGAHTALSSADVGYRVPNN